MYLLVIEVKTLVFRLCSSPFFFIIFGLILLFCLLFFFLLIVLLVGVDDCVLLLVGNMGRLWQRLCVVYIIVGVYCTSCSLYVGFLLFTN